MSHDFMLHVVVLDCRLVWANELATVGCNFNSESQTRKEFKSNSEVEITVSSGCFSGWVILSSILSSSIPVFHPSLLSILLHHVYLSSPSVSSRLSLSLSLVGSVLPPSSHQSLFPYGGLGWFAGKSMLIRFIQTEGDHWAISNYTRSY